MDSRASFDSAEIPCYGARSITEDLNLRRRTIDIILIPGLWLNACTWREITPALEQADYRVHALTLPGMESNDTDRHGIALSDHVDAVIAAIDEAEGPVLLVGHSAGGGIAHIAVDARPDKVARVVYVGGFPSVDGEPLLEGFPSVDGEISMPNWFEVGDQSNISDFEKDSLDRLYADAVPAPERVLTDPVLLHDERRLAVPVTAVCTEYTISDVRSWIESGEAPVRELGRIHDVSYVELPGGHWPQLTQPDRLNRILLDIAAQTRPAREFPAVELPPVESPPKGLKRLMGWKAGGRP